MKPLHTRISSAICLALACAMPLAQAQQATPPAEQAQDKFALLGLISAASSGVSIWQTLSDWFGSRVERVAAPVPGATLQAVVPPPASPAAAGTAISYDRAPSFGPAPLVLGQPDVPLQAHDGGPQKAWDGQANYQGLALSVVVLDQQNRVKETRSLAQAIRNGEHFKLRVVSTADGLVSLDALHAQPGSIDPNGVMRQPPAWGGQFYPAKADQVVQLKAGEVVYLPLGAGEYFTFDERQGNDLLALNMRQPRAGSRQPNLQPVYRQDGQGVTTFAQLSQPGSYFNLTQILAARNQ